MVENILIVASVAFIVAGITPYIIDVIKGKTKPRIVSWFIWCVLTIMAFVAALVEQRYPTAILLSFSVVSTVLVVVLGWKNGNKKVGRLDIACLISAGVGIILWQVFNSPELAVVATIAINLVGGIPTLIHSWEKPGEETWAAYLFTFFGASCTLLTISNWQITAFAFPLYLALNNLTFALVIILRQRLVVKK